MDQGVEQSVDQGSPFTTGDAIAAPANEPFAPIDRWHELLTSRYVCEACLTRYFMKYRKCKACGAIGRIRLLTASLFDLADDDSELREMIAHGQRMMFEESPPRESPPPADHETAAEFDI